MNTYNAQSLRLEIQMYWPERHRRLYIRSAIRSCISDIRRMEAK